MKKIGLAIASTLGGLTLLGSGADTEVTQVQPIPIVTAREEKVPLRVEQEVVKSIPQVIPKPIVKEIYKETPTPPPVESCHSGYSGCLDPHASDYDCAGGSGNGPKYTGKVQVYGSDPFGLDRDNDGWGCE